MSRAVEKIRSDFKSILSKKGIGGDNNDTNYIFLRFVVEPWLIAALMYTGVAILCPLIFAAFLANLALKPIEQIGARLDALALAEAEGAGEPAAGRSSDAVIVTVPSVCALIKFHALVVPATRPSIARFAR